MTSLKEILINYFRSKINNNSNSLLIYKLMSSKKI